MTYMYQDAYSQWTLDDNLVNCNWPLIYGETNEKECTNEYPDQNNFTNNIKSLVGSKVQWWRKENKWRWWQWKVQWWKEAINNEIDDEDRIYIVEIKVQSSKKIKHIQY